MSFSLLLAPIAHAGGLTCAGSTCFMMEIMHASATDKKDGNDLVKSGHHCCCTHLSAKIDPIKVDSASVSTHVVIANDDSLTSVVLGPPPEPPCHA